MLGTHPMTNPLRGLVQRFQDWPVASQQQARRNAMIASTACAQRRVERREVDDYLATLAAETEAPHATASATKRTQHG